MSQVVSRHEVPSRPSRPAYAPVEAEMEQVESLLWQELRSRDAHVDKLVKYGFRLGGKRLRPALVLLSGSATGTLEAGHISLAAAMELVHTATLIHDDVLDEAQIRRHLDTVNARWDNQTSILLGDFLFTHAFQLAMSLDDMEICRTIVTSTKIVCEGELSQVNRSGDLNVSENEYYAIIRAKTAELTACCCAIGSQHAGANETVKRRLESYGLNLGMAFQIADDLLDVLGVEEETGKTLGADLAKQKATLPLIHFLQTASPGKRDKILSMVGKPGQAEREQIAEWMTQAGAIEYARQRATHFSQLAREDLSQLPSSTAVDTLTALTYSVIDRNS